MIVAITKMDTCDYSETRYDTIKTRVVAQLEKIGYKPAKINFVPISGLVGDNLIDCSSQMPWFKGPCLSAALDSLNPLNGENLADKPLRMQVRQSHRIGGIGTVVAVNVLAGTVKPGIDVRVGPAGKRTRIRSIERSHVGLESAGREHGGVAVCLSGLNFKEVKIGDVIAATDGMGSLPACLSFEAQLIIMEKPGKSGVITEGCVGRPVEYFLVSIVSKSKFPNSNSSQSISSRML